MGRLGIVDRVTGFGCCIFVFCGVGIGIGGVDGKLDGSFGRLIFTPLLHCLSRRARVE